MGFDLLKPTSAFIRSARSDLPHDHEISAVARDWMLEDKANRVVETVRRWTCTEHVLWERKEKTKPMQLASKGLGCGTG